MNVCLVLISDVWGGGEAVVYELARHLREKGNRVTVVLNREILGLYQGLENVTLFDIGNMYPFRSTAESKLAIGSRYDLPRRLLALVCGYLDELYRYVYFKGAQTLLQKLIIQNDIEVIHAHLSNAIVMISGACQLGPPKVATIHGEHALIGRGPISIFLYPLMTFNRKIFRRALIGMDGVTAVSIFISRALCSWEPSLGAKVFVIPNGVNVSEIRSATNQPPKLRGELSLIFPGGARPRKGGDLVLEAVRTLKQEIPNIHVYVTGDVPKAHFLRKMVRRMNLQLNVTFTGLLNPKEHHRLLKSVDMLVMPSREEASSLVYLEAMALGKPIVAAIRGGVPATVENGRNGILTELDPEHVAIAVLELFRNKELFERISRNNLEDSMRFEWSGIIDQYIQLYKDLSNWGSRQFKS